MTRLRALHYLTISSYFFGLSFMWSGVNAIILPALVVQLVPEALKGTYLGAMTFAGLFLAMIVQPISGALSDQTRVTWGRRRPWILGGAIGSMVGLMLIGLVSSYGALAFSYLFLQLCSNTAHGPMQGIIPDLTPRRRRGVASGIKNLLDMAGFLSGSLVAGYFMGRGQAGLALSAIILTLAGSLAVMLFGMREPRPAEAPAGIEALTVSRLLRRVFRFNIRAYPDYAWLLVSRFMVLAGVYAIQGFAQFFIRDILGSPNPARTTAYLMAAIGIGTAALVYPGGYVSDRFGRKRWTVLSAFVCGVGVFLLLTVVGYRQLFFAGALIGIGLGSFLSTNWALATELAPAEEAGKYLGLSNLATAGAGAVGRLAGPLIDLLNAYGGGRGYQALFILAGCSICAGALCLWWKVREPARPTRTA